MKKGLSATGMRNVAPGDGRDSPRTRDMAALAALGFEVVPERAWDYLSGTGKVVFHHSAECRDPGWAGKLRGVRLMREGNLVQLERAKPLLRVAREGWLEGEVPLHPFLDCRRAMANFDALEGWRLGGVTCCLAGDAVPAGKPVGMAERARLVPGMPPVRPVRKQGVKKRDVVWVGNVANAAALAMLGVPVLGLAVKDGKTVYEMGAVSVLPFSVSGVLLSVVGPSFATAAMLLEAREGRLGWDHPFMVGRQGVLFLVAMLRAMEEAREHTVLTIRNGTDQRMATILSSASGKARDMVHRHMK